MKFVLCFIFSLSALAGDKVGNGGDGIMFDGKPYLLDLIEHGVEEGLLNEEACECGISSTDFESMLNPAISEKPVRRIIIRKLTELCSVSSATAAAVVVASQKLLFSKVRLGLVDIKDEDTPIDYDPQKLVQLAARQRSNILIDKSLWSKLDDWNRAALIFHEIVYAMTYPVPSEGGHSKQWSPYARDIVGSLFSGALIRMDRLLANSLIFKLYHPTNIETSPVGRLQNGQIGYFKFQKKTFLNESSLNAALPELAKDFCSFHKNYQHELSFERTVMSSDPMNYVEMLGNEKVLKTSVWTSFFTEEEIITVKGSADLQQCMGNFASAVSKVLTM